MICRNCSTKLAKGNNRSGLCRECYVKDPAAKAERAARARRLRIWDHARSACPPEVKARISATLTERWLGHIPTDYRPLYRHLTRQIRMSAAEATEIVLNQHQADMARGQQGIAA